ncbi:MAG TPA: ribbon-helix-helix protein, CopG family [Pyrinomonadaceae bacterium]|nr:ribbon-helix-helix protein, CopG family [Pyrinomonadaceae bacterium]
MHRKELPEKTSKTATSVRLSLEAKRLIKLLSQKMGISQSAVLELSIREKAEKEKVG